jgi:hypothetical protein
MALGGKVFLVSKESRNTSTQLALEIGDDEGLALLRSDESADVAWEERGEVGFSFLVPSICKLDALPDQLDCPAYEARERTCFESESSYWISIQRSSPDP